MESVQGVGPESVQGVSPPDPRRPGHRLAQVVLRICGVLFTAVVTGFGEDAGKALGELLGIH